MPTLAALKPWRWLAVPLLGLAAYALGNCNGKYSAHQVAAFQQAHAILEAGKLYRDSLRVLGQLVQQIQDSVAQAEQRARIRGRLVQQLDTALSRAANERDSLRIALQQTVVLRGQVRDLQQAIVSLEQALATARAATTLAQSRVDSLETHLRSTLQVAECRWDLLIVHPQCPSRTTIAIVSLGVGVVGTLLVRH